MIEEILRHNRAFVEEKRYDRFITNKYPDKKIAILSCMDTRLTKFSSGSARNKKRRC